MTTIEYEDNTNRKPVKFICEDGTSILAENFETLPDGKYTYEDGGTLEKKGDSISYSSGWLDGKDIKWI